MTLKGQYADIAPTHQPGAKGNAMKIPISFPDAERLTASLLMSVVDSVSEAGADAEKTLSCLREATAYAHTLARFLDRLTDAVAGEVPLVIEETDEQHELRLAVAARRVTPIRPGGDAA